MLATGYQVWLTMRPMSSIMFLVFNCISNASFTRQSTYPYVPSHIEVPLKLMLCSATADYSGWSRHVSCVLCTWSQQSFCSAQHTLSHTHKDSNKHQGPEDLTCLWQTAASVWFCCLRCELFRYYALQEVYWLYKWIHNYHQHNYLIVSSISNYMATYFN